MKRFVIAVSVVVLVFAVAVWAQPPAQTKSGSVEQDLIKLENGWNDALVKHDWAFLDQILADDCTWADSDGNVLSKAQFLARMKSVEQVVTSAVSDEMKVRVYGDAAGVIGRNTEKSQYKGTDTSGQYQWTDTWIKHAGHWRCVASHASKIAQK